MGSGVVAERRLRPLWDAIDSRQYKTALKLASALQSKHADVPYILILKALVLERLGKPDESLATCRQAKQMQPMDDLSLSAMELVYQRLGIPDEVIEVYESACTKNPGNLELLIRLFNCHVRQQNYVKQQQTAMKIYKLTGDYKHLMWAACSIYSQVRPGNAAEKKLLPLAEALINKMIESKSMQDSEALSFYIKLLLDQNKHEDALSVLSGSLGELFTMPVERLRRQGEILMSLQRFKEAAAVYKEILSISPDDWNAITQLINATLKSPANSSELDEAMSSLSISKAEAFNDVADVMRGLQSSDTQEVMRGPFLALVELENRKIQHEISGASDVSLTDCILKYFERFGHLASFYSDVKVYLSTLKDEHSREFLITQLEEALSGLDSSEPVKLLRRRVAVYQVREHIGKQAEGIGFARELVTVYLENLKYSADLDPEESIIGEELLVMAVNCIVKHYLQTRDFGLLMEAISVLEFGLSSRRWNRQFKLMLVSLYSSIFAVTLAIDWFKALDIKNILFEVSSHHVLPVLLESYYWSELELLLTNSIKFHEDAQYEAGDMAILAYKQGNYTGTYEFVDLQHRLVNSHHFLVSRTEMVLLAVKQNTEKLDVVEELLAKHDDGKKVLTWSDESNIATLTFNEDLDNRPWWSPMPDFNILTRETSDHQGSVGEFQQRMRARAKRRSCIPRLLFLSLNALATEKNGQESRRDELKQLLECYLESLNTPLRTLIDLADFTKKDPKDCDPELLSALVFFLAWQLHSADSDEAAETISFLSRLFTSHLQTLLKPSPPGSELGTSTPMLIKLVSEPIAWLTLSSQAWMKRLQPGQKRKKKPAPAETIEEKKVLRLVEGLRGMVAGIQSGLEAVILWVEEETRGKSESQGVERLVAATSSSEILKLLESEPGLNRGEEWSERGLLGKIVSSRRGALAGLGHLCGVRLKQLKTLK